MIARFRSPEGRFSLAASFLLSFFLAACGAPSDPVADDAMPTTVSSSRIAFDGPPVVAGTRLSPENPLTLTYIPGRRLAPGEHIALSFPTAVQEESDALWTIPTAEPSGEGAVQVGGAAGDRIEVAEAGRARGGAGRIVLRVTRAIDAGEEIRLGLTGRAPSIVSTAPFRVLEIGGDGAVAALPDENVERAPVVAAPAVAVRVSVDQDLLAGAAARVRVAALDPFGNVASSYRGRVAFDTPFPGLPREYVFTEEDAGLRVFEAAAPSATGVVRIAGRAEIEGATTAIASNPARVWSSAPRYRRFAGDAHFHSGSDVASPAVPGGDHRGQFVDSADAYRYLRDVASLDWGISAEHDTGMTAKGWLANQRRVDGYSEEGRFVTLLGYEWTPERRVGHHVVVFDGEASERNPLVAADRPGPGGAAAVAPTVFDLVSTFRTKLSSAHRALVIPHVMQPFPNRDPERKDAAEPHEIWDGPAGTRAGGYNFPDLRRVAEIYSHHNDDFTAGSYVQTTEGRGNAVDQPQLFELGVANSWSFQHAWATGQRVGVVGGSDNHFGTPGMDDYSPSVLHHAGLTVVLAETLTRAAVFDALYSRRCYATTGPRIWLDFTVAGEVMGAESYRKAGEALPIALSVEGTAPIASVELLKLVGGDFRVVHTLGGTGSGSVSTTITDRLEEPTIYYLRVRQEDGEMAWTSPIWIDVRY